MPLRERSTLPAITGLRILLALWVAVYHISGVNTVLRDWVAREPLALRGLVGSGPLAVGIFFLLSGFVLAYNYDLSEPWTPVRLRQFWLARFARIYPVYLFALIVGLPSLFAGLIKAGPIHFAYIARRMSEVLLLVQAWVPPDASFWGGAAWSLSAEFFFYLCFPFLGSRLWKIGSLSAQIWTILGLWALCFVTSFTLAAWKAPTFDVESFWSELIKRNPLIRLPEFLAGILLCRLFLHARHRLRGRGWILYAPALIVIAFAAAESRFLSHAALHDGLLMPASALLIVGLALGGGAIARGLSYSWMVTLGQASYALYLLHVPVYSYFAAAGKRLVHTGTQEWLLLSVYAVTLVCISVLTLRAIEDPARRWILLRQGRTAVVELAPASADPM